MSKINYLLRSVANLSKKGSCPYCSNKQTELVKDGKSQVIDGEKAGLELLVIARPNILIK